MESHENFTLGSAVEKKHDPSLPFFSRFFLVFISLTIIISNLIILTVLRHTRTCLIKMQLFLKSLAMADLLVGLTWFILHFEAIIGEDLYEYSNWVCLMVIHLPAIALLVSILTLSLISVERFIAIVKPFQYHKLITPRRARCAVASVWLLSTVLFIPVYLALLFATGGQPQRNCENNFKDVLHTCFYILAIIIIPNVFLSLYCYTYIIKNVVRRDKHLCNHQSSMQRGRRRNEHALVKISISVYSGFYITWLPFVLVSFVAYINVMDISDVVYFTTLNMGLCNSLLNCLIYSISHKPFRAELKLLMLSAIRSCCCIRGSQRRQAAVRTEHWRTTAFHSPEHKPQLSTISNELIRNTDSNFTMNGHISMEIHGNI